MRLRRLRACGNAEQLIDVAFDNRAVERDAAAAGIRPTDALERMLVVAVPSATALNSVAKAQARKPCAVSRKNTSSRCARTQRARMRPAISPPTVEASIATATMNTPEPT